MKESLRRILYPVVLLSILVTAGLQFAWLYELYKAQTVRIKEQLEAVIRDAAHRQMLRSVQSKLEVSSNFRDFFDSKEWIQLRQSFDDMNVVGLRSNFHYGFTTDSANLSIDFSFPIKPAKGAITQGRGAFNKESKKELTVIERESLKDVSRDIDSALKQVPIRNSYAYRVFDYNDNHLISGLKLGSTVKDFVSKKYSYNLKHLHKYQLVVPQIRATVLYSMRYYLLSSAMMLLLTVAAFYVLLRLMRNQQLYAEARQAFTSNMTHELKTPIATVAVALESIGKYDLIHHPEKLKNYLEISKHELQRLNLMIEKVLSLETEGNHAAPHKELFDVQQVLQDVIYAMTLQFSNEGGSVNFKPSAEPCFMEGDPIQLSHVFYNLLDNALKYAGPAAILNINCSISGDTISISFADQGMGIGVDYQARIFERYFRVPGRGDTHDVKGSGLGLNYVQQIVKQHLGEVSLKSELGKGCTFTLKLPAHEV